MTTPPTRRTPGPSAALGVRRSDGRWQLGVGPGALVLDRPVRAGTAAAGLADAMLRAAPPPTHGSTTAPVQGQGHLARNLREALGNLDPGREDGVLVLVGQRVIDPLHAVEIVSRGRPVLPVVVQQRRVVMGPFWAPGPAPCLHCLDLLRRDRDPDWPGLAQLLGDPVSQAEPVATDPAVADAAVALVRVLVASIGGGALPEPGLALELGPDPPHLVQRRWVRHPGCPWHPAG